jgi:hypothetical protein
MHKSAKDIDLTVLISPQHKTPCLRGFLLCEARSISKRELYRNLKFQTQPVHFPVRRAFFFSTQKQAPSLLCSTRMLSLLNPNAETIRRGQALQVTMLPIYVADTPGKHHSRERITRCSTNKSWSERNDQNARRRIWTN